MTDVDMVDVSLPVQAPLVPANHAWALAQALCKRLGWLSQEPMAGVHPIKLAQGNAQHHGLAARARLLLRLPRQRVSELDTLAQSSLTVDDTVWTLGDLQVREIQAHSTLYAYRVHAPQDTEAAFMQQVEQSLQQMGVQAHTVCGLHQSLPHPVEPLASYSLMLHGLDAAQSVRVQQQGLGLHRLMGCGVFVPHKSAAAV